MESVAATRNRRGCQTPAAVLPTLLLIICALLPAAVFAQGQAARRELGTSNPRAATIYRSAAALQNRDLLDLAAAEWATLVEQFPQDPLVGKALYHRGICLVRLKRFAEAEVAFQRVVSEYESLEPTLLEQAYANLGLVQYNRAMEAEGAERATAFEVASATFDTQLTRFPDGRCAAQATFYRAEACYAREDLEGALVGYQRVVDRHPEDPLRAAALYGLGIVQQEIAQLTEAGATFDRLLEEFPEHKLTADAYMRRGELLLLQREFDAAIELLTRLDEAFPESSLLGEALYIRGQCRAAIGDDAEAAADFRRVSECWPDSPAAPQALFACAQLEQRRRDLSASQLTLGRFLVNYRDDALVPQARLLRAKVRHELGLFSDAIADSDTLLQGETIDAAVRDEAVLLRGMCEAKLYRVQDAVRTFESVVRNSSRPAAIERALYELAWAYDNNGQPQQAVATFRQLATDHADSPRAAECWFRVGESQFSAGQFAEAAESYSLAKSGSADEPIKEKAAHKLAWAQFSLDLFDEAEQTFAGQVAEYSKGRLAADARIMVAECKFARDDFSGATAAYTKSLTNATASDELVELGLLHGAQSAAQLKEWNKCAALAERLLREFPESEAVALARCELGLAQYHLKEFEAAQRGFTALVNCEDKGLQARARFMLGEIHFARREYDAAVRAFFNVAYGYGDGAPDTVRQWQAESLFEAARCLEQSKRRESARKIYGELVERFPENEKAEHARVAIERRSKNVR